MDSIILCGMQFGDEGKGTFTDYLVDKVEADAVIRYNGGSQASHTVTTPNGIVHKFSQLGSGMFSEKCHTYLTENMVVNLDNLLFEINVFCKETGYSFKSITKRVHIHENCFIVTPYHKLMNKLRELWLGENRRGSVGTGVSEVPLLLKEGKALYYKQPLGVQVKHIFNFTLGMEQQLERSQQLEEFLTKNNPVENNIQLLERLKALQDHVAMFYQEHKVAIWQNVPEKLKKPLEQEVTFLLEPSAFLKVLKHYLTIFRKVSYDMSLKRCLYSDNQSGIRDKCKKAVFEGAQGLLLDRNYGIKPNTTYLDTTNHFALILTKKEDKITRIGIAKAFASRHGKGIFPTESEEVNSKVVDRNQESTFWNGKIRFGWFDAVLFRYAQSINNVDEVYLSSLDLLDEFSVIRICNAYEYIGKVDENFKKFFYYRINEDGNIIITDIKKNGDELESYLSRCTPIYVTVKGWEQKTSEMREKRQLPKECIAYISRLEKIIRVPITMVSVGPTRENKISFEQK